MKAAQIAKDVASGYGGWVAGSMGPGTKLPSLGQIRFADLRDAYEVQARGLLEGGVDLLLIETITSPADQALAYRRTYAPTRSITEAATVTVRRMLRVICLLL